MDYHQALQLRAMHAVMHPDGEAFMRAVKRFYSKTFNVPLPDVDDIPEEDVLVAFYEETFAQMDKEDRLEFLDELLLSPEEKKKREADLDEALEADEAFLKKMNEDLKSGKRRGPPPERKKVKMPVGPADPKERAKAIRDRIAKGITTPEPESRPPPTPPPDIHMKFGEEDGNLLGIPTEWLDMDPSGAPSPKK